jgi:hypothetical protein
MGDNVFEAMSNFAEATANQAQAQNQSQQSVISPDRQSDKLINFGGRAFREEEVYYDAYQTDAKGNVSGGPPSVLSHK